MSFLDEVSKRVDYAVTEVSSRAKELTGIAKLNASISAREREIEATFTQIGKLLFEQESQNPESPAAALCAKITANRESIAEMKNKIVQIKEEESTVRKNKSDELFRAPAPEKTEAGCACEAAKEACETAEEACDCAKECICEAAEEVCACAEACAEEVAEEAGACVDAVCEAAEEVCGCAKECVDEAVETVSENLSDFYPQTNDQ